MLEAYFGEFNKVNEARFTPYSVAELCALMDRLAAARRVSSYGRGMSGHHAWICLRSADYDLCLYFGEDCRPEGVIDFHLYGPLPAGEERARAHPFDGRGLAGTMAIAAAKELLALLDVPDAGDAPTAFVRESAVEAYVVRD